MAHRRYWHGTDEGYSPAGDSSWGRAAPGVPSEDRRPTQGVGTPSFSDQPRNHLLGTACKLVCFSSFRLLSINRHFTHRRCNGGFECEGLIAPVGCGAYKYAGLPVLLAGLFHAAWQLCRRYGERTPLNLFAQLPEFLHVNVA